MIKLPTITSVKNLKDKKVLLRLDLNVPIKDGVVTDDFRIRKIIPTLKFLEEAGAKTIIISHLDEKEGKTLEPAAKILISKFPRMKFIRDIYSNEARSETDNVSAGNFVLFENIRNWKGEKENDPEFVKHLTSFAEIYVNDAFSASHRKHASIVGVPGLLPSFIGPLFASEVENLSKAFSPSHPFVFLMGGAKFETKIPLLNKFLPLCDTMFIGGAIANDFFKAKGYFLGDSTVSEENFKLDDMMKNPKVVLPIDVRTQHKGFRFMKKPTEISIGERIWDMGEKTMKNLALPIRDASFVVWNGPMGNLEAGETAGTIELARLVSQCRGMTIVGGGDTVAALEKTEFFSKFTFVSTGGGAMLDFLANETLPGIDAIRKKTAPKAVSWFKRLFS